MLRPDRTFFLEPQVFYPSFACEVPVYLQEMDSGSLKEEEERLRRDIILRLETQFVEEFKKWAHKVEMFNEMVAEYNASGAGLKKVGYDQFCRLMVDSSKSLLREHIVIDRIVPDRNELEDIRSAMKNPDDGDDFKRRYAAVFEAKYAAIKKRLAGIWDGYAFEWIVTRMYGKKHLQGLNKVKRKLLGS